MGFLGWLGTCLLDKGEANPLREADERLEGDNRYDHAQRDEQEQCPADFERYAMLNESTISSRSK